MLERFFECIVMEVFANSFNLEVVFIVMVRWFHLESSLMTCTWGKDFRPFKSTVVTSSENSCAMKIVIPAPNLGVTSRVDARTSSIRIFVTAGAKKDSLTAAIAKLQFSRTQVTTTALLLQPITYRSVHLLGIQVNEMQCENNEAMNCLFPGPRQLLLHDQINANN